MAAYSPVSCRPSPVIPFSSPNAACASLWGTPILPLRAGKRAARGPYGKAADIPQELPCGCRCAASEHRLADAIRQSGRNRDPYQRLLLLGAVVEIGLAGMRAVQAYFFD